MIYWFKNKKFSIPVHIFDKETVEKLNLKYYNSDLHKASFVMPNLFQNVIYVIKFDFIHLYIIYFKNRIWTRVLQTTLNNYLFSIYCFFKKFLA